MPSEYLSLERPLRERRREAEAVRPLAIPVRGTLEERLAIVAGNASRGFYAMQERDVLPTRRFSRKRGPFVEYLTRDDDLRGLRARILEHVPPATALWQGHRVPSQLVGFHVGRYDGPRYLVRFTDLINSQLLYRGLRRTGTIITQDDDHWRVGYAHGITIDLYGVRPGAVVSFTASARLPKAEALVVGENLSKESGWHEPWYTLSTTAHGLAPDASFDIRSGTVQRDLSVRGVHILDRGCIHLFTDRENKALAERRHALYLTDLLGLELIRGFLKRACKLDLNDPFPRLLESDVRLAQDVFTKAYLVAGEKRRKITRAQGEVIFNMLRAARR